MATRIPVEPRPVGGDLVLFRDGSGTRARPTGALPVRIAARRPG